MAGLKRKLEGEIEMSEDAKHAFHDILQNRPHHVSNIHPEFIQSCDLHEGSFGSIGAIISWDYVLDDGESQTLKQEITEIDEENKMMKFKCIGGALAEEFRNFHTTFKVVPKDDQHCIVKWIFDYEKLEAATREPSTEMNALIELTRKIDEDHKNQNN